MDTVELLIPLEPLAWLYRHDPSVLRDARILHTDARHSEQVTPSPEPPEGDEHGLQVAMMAAVRNAKGPFLDATPIHCHLARNPTGIFLLSPIRLQGGQQIELVPGLLLRLLVDLGYELHAGAVVSHLTLRTRGIGRYVRMTRGASAWLQTLGAVPGASAIKSAADIREDRVYGDLVERVLALRPPTDGEIDQAHEALRLEQRRALEKERRELMRAAQAADSALTAAIAKSDEAQRRVRVHQAAAQATQLALDTFDQKHGFAPTETPT